MAKSKMLKNIIVSFGGQFVVLLLGIIVPKIMISNYGSDTNGVLSTVTQIFTYMALLEAGIGQATKNALFKPITENNKNEISHIMSISRRYFRKITLYYGICVVAVSLIMPVLLKTEIGKLTVFLIILLEGMSGVLSFYFIQSTSVLLVADGRSYINNYIVVINKLLSYTAKIVLAILGFNVIFLEFVYFTITIFKVVFYQIYEKKNYSWINYNASSSEEVLKDRNAFVITEIAWTIFSSTDMIVLSLFVSTKLSSVYSIYNMIFVNLNVLLNTVYNSVNYKLGQTFHEDIVKYQKIHDIYNSIFFGGMTILMCVAYVMALPFIRLYTHGITDMNYIVSGLPFLFCLVQILSWSRYVTGNLVGVAGYAKPTMKISAIEAVINMVLSIVLVKKFELIGVLIATVCALPLKVIWCTYVSDRLVLKRSVFNTIKILLSNYILFGLIVFISGLISFNTNSYFDLLFQGCIVFIICLIIGMVINILVNKSLLDFLRQKLNKN